MDELERLIEGTRKLRELGATSVTIGGNGMAGFSLSATFAPPMTPDAKPAAPPTDAEVDEARLAMLLAST